MNSYSISIYNPKKLSSRMPFYLSLKSDTIDEQFDDLDEETPKTFNTESSKDYMNKNISINDIYVKNYTLNLYLDKNRPMETTFGYIKGILINTKLMAKDGLTIYDVYPEEMMDSNNIQNNYLMRFLLSITDEEGYIKLNGKGNVFYVSQVYVNRKQRGKGFGHYLVQNFPDYLERFFGVSFNLVAVPLFIFESEEDMELMKTEEAMKKFQNDCISAMMNIFEKEKYCKLCDDASEFTEDVSIYIKMNDTPINPSEPN